MKHSPVQRSAYFAPAALADSKVGTWEYDVATDLFRYDTTVGELFALPIEMGEEGVACVRVIGGVYPQDLPKFMTKHAFLLTHGGLFVVEYRTVTAKGDVRWVLARGRYEADPAGRIVRGRGICIDLTDSKEDGYADGNAYFLTGSDDEDLASPLDRAADHALAARQAIDELGEAGLGGLRARVDALLFEIGRCLGALVPKSDGRRH